MAKVISVVHNAIHRALRRSASPSVRMAIMNNAPTRGRNRSEEHTSELQSLRHLVCRLLLEKKNHVTPIDIDDNSLALARSISQIPCRKESVYATSLPERSCDSAVCCDSIQHFDISHFAPSM